MKNFKKTSLSFLVSLCLLSGVAINLIPTINVSANSIQAPAQASTENSTVATTVDSVFKDRSISSSGYMYNLDESADYVYTEFNEGGYAIFAKQTMEMLEYSASGCLPYNLTSSKMYYAGPTNYIQKQNNKFIDIMSKSEVVMSANEIATYAKKLRKTLIEDKLAKYQFTNQLTNYSNQTVESLINASNGLLSNSNSAPNIDTDHLITVNPASLTSTGTFIYDKAYFTTKLTIGRAGSIIVGNNTGTCGPIAAQLLLGFNNYYNDRRIIPDKYLNGYSDTANAVVNKELNPNHCTDPTTFNMWTTGTRSDGNDSNSFFYKLATTIMNPKTDGVYFDDLKKGIISYLNEYVSPSEYNLKYKENYNWFSGYSSVDPQEIKSEIDTGRPIIISMNKSLGGVNHCVVGYGYQNYRYENNINTYSGYVVHFGWYKDYLEQYNSVWINESWCSGYIALKMQHIHSDVKIGSMPNDAEVDIIKCTTCGRRSTRLNISGGDGGGIGGRPPIGGGHIGEIGTIYSFDDPRSRK